MVDWFPTTTREFEQRVEQLKIAQLAREIIVAHARPELPAESFVAWAYEVASAYYARRPSSDSDPSRAEAPRT